MGAAESNDSSEQYAGLRNQLVRGTGEHDQFQVLRMQAERSEIRIGGQRVEAQRIRVASASVSGNRLQVSEREQVQIRVQASPVPGLGRRTPQLALRDGESSDEDPDPDGKCTYDDDGPGFLLQPWYRCYTCWGDDADESCFGCCSHCADTCHQGHRLESFGLEKAECDCGQYKHQAAVCTWHVTNKNFVKQPFYRCFDCFTESSSGVCYQCWKVCHRKHNTVYIGVMPAFCDCGLTSCSIKCSIPAPK